MSNPMKSKKVVGWGLGVATPILNLGHVEKAEKPFKMTEW